MKNSEIEHLALDFRQRQYTNEFVLMFCYCCYCRSREPINPLMPILIPQSNGLLYYSTVIGTSAIDRWAVTFGTARRGLDGLRPCPVLSSLYQM